MKFRKKPVVVDSMQFTMESKNQCYNFVRGNCFAHFVNGEPALTIETLEGNMTAREGDWVIKGVNGEFYPCKQDIFEKTYEPIEE
jgi:hypothetical protein